MKATRRISNYLYPLIFLLMAGLFTGCATTPPVQEMSNARQTITAAQEAKAKVYAPEQLEEAERLMSQATVALESGDYAAARELAIAAQQQAIKARQLAISKQNN